MTTPNKCSTEQEKEILLRAMAVIEEMPVPVNERFLQTHHRVAGAADDVDDVDDDVDDDDVDHVDAANDNLRDVVTYRDGIPHMPLAYVVPLICTDAIFRSASKRLPANFIEHASTMNLHMEGMLHMLIYLRTASPVNPEIARGWKPEQVKTAIVKLLTGDSADDPAWLRGPKTNDPTCLGPKVAEELVTRIDSTIATIRDEVLGRRK